MLGDDWKHTYSRQQAGLPVSFLEERKFWPTVSRIDDVYGDRVLEFTRALPKRGNDAELAAASG